MKSPCVIASFSHVIAGLTRNPLKFLIVLIVLTVPACSDDDPILGSISFTSSADCNIRLFDSNGREIARENYEVGKAPFVVQMKRSGIFIVRAVNGDKTYKEPLTYAISNHEYFIEF